MANTFGVLAPGYAAQWCDMQIKPSRIQGFNALATKLIKRIPQYRAIERATGVPVAVIAVIHEREGSGDFSTYLGNGQPWNQRTTIVPKGRGPWASFADAATDALLFEGLDKVKDWSVERALFVLEGYNGFGYRSRGIPSPYLWGGTNIQKPGKFVRDGVFDPSVIDMQPGCAPLLYTLFGLDRTLALRLSGEPPAPQPSIIIRETPDIPPPRYVSPPAFLPDYEPPSSPPQSGFLFDAIRKWFAGWGK